MKHSVICMVLVLLLPLAIGAQGSQPVYPVKFKSCDPPDNVSPASMIWDNMITEQNKWCCFHAGYETPQEHWAVMDFGKEYELDKIQVFHEGYMGNPIFNTEDYTISISTEAMDGPWEVLADIKDNADNINTIAGNGKTFRYIKFFVTDNEVVGEPNTPNGDYAVRILELKVMALTDEQSSPPAPAPTTPGTTPPSPFTRAVQSPIDTTPPTQSTPIQPVYPTQSTPPTTALKPYTAVPPPVEKPFISAPTPTPEPTMAAVISQKPILYYFYSPKVHQSLELYNGVLGSPEVLRYIASYKVIPVNYQTQSKMFQDYRVVRIPTIIIANTQGTETKRHAGEFTTQEIITFLNK